MKHLFVPYELALKLKEKGFDEPCILYYSSGMLQLNQPSTMFGWKVKELIELNSYDKQVDKRILAPTYQQVIDWFRENRKINIKVEKDYIINKWYPVIRTEIPGVLYDFETDNFRGEYYQAFNKAIEEALKLI